MRRVVQIAAAGMLAASAVQAQAQPTSLGEITAAMRKIVDYEKKDEFDPGPNNAIFANQDFTIRVPVVSEETGLGRSAATYTYDAVSQTLTVTLNTVGFLVTNPLGWWAGYTVDKSIERFGDYEAQNGLGARFVVRKGRTTTFLIGLPSALKSPANQRKTVAKLNLPPDQARIVATTRELVLGGTVTPYDGKNTVTCSTIGGRPTTTSAVDVEERTCFLTAAITRIELLPKDTAATDVEPAGAMAAKQAWLDGTAAQFAAELPRKIGGDITVVRAQSANMVMTLDAVARRASTTAVNAHMAKLVPAMCVENEMQPILSVDATIRIRVSVPKVVVPLDFDVSKATCAALSRPQ